VEPHPPFNLGSRSKRGSPNGTRDRVRLQNYARLQAGDQGTTAFTSLEYELSTESASREVAT